MGSRNEKIKWLKSEMDGWVSGGIIDRGTSERIINLYPEDKGTRSWAMIVFSAIGAIVIGLGVILLFAYNWEDMSKYAKLSAIFGFLICSHTAGFVIYFYTERFKAIGEALGVLGTMLFGAGIWLVAQIYHIDEHYPNAFLFWGIGAMLLAWTVPSISQAIVAAILFTIWAIAEGAAFRTQVPLVFVFLLSLFPLAYKKKNGLLLAVLLMAVWLTLVFAASVKYDELALFVLLGLFTLYMAIGVNHCKFSQLEFFGIIYRFIGLLGYFVVLYILCFRDVSDELSYSREMFSDVGSAMYWVVPFVLSMVGFGLIVKDVYVKKQSLDCYSGDYILMPLVLVFYLIYSYSLCRVFEWPGMAVFNLVFLAHMLMMMGRGCAKTLAHKVILGAIGLGALTFARFTDLFDNLLIRGFVFIVFGAVIFAQGFFYVSSKRKKSLGGDA